MGVLTVDGAFGVEDGLVYDFGAPDERCAVFEGSQAGGHFDIVSRVDGNGRRVLWTYVHRSGPSVREIRHS